MIFICRQQDIPVAKEEMIFNYKQEHPALSKAAKRMKLKYQNLEYPPVYYEQYKDKLICIVRTGVDTYNVYFKT